jgi:hypothetical protein
MSKFGDHPLEESIPVSPNRTIHVTGAWAVDWRRVKDTPERDEWVAALVKHADEARARLKR